MSLHIGRLSPDVRQPYLEHLFQKYGRCVVNLKDGYGFAVYDSNADAAGALRAMHGKLVCGRRITVNWSKQQPRFSQGFRRSSHRRTSRDDRENIRFRDFLAVKNHPANHDDHHDKNHIANHDGSHGKNPPASHDDGHDKNHLGDRDESHDPASALEKGCDKVAEGVDAAAANIGEEVASLEDVKRDERGTVDASAIEHERWAEAGKGSSGDGGGFDCYEPYHGLVRQKKSENAIKSSSWESNDHGRSSEKWQQHSNKHVDIRHDKSRSPPTCYTCGVSGHIARYCPEGIDAKFKARRDGLNFREKWELRQRRFGSPSRRRELHVHPMDQKHQRAQDGRIPIYDIKKRVPRSSNVHRESRRHDHNSENMQQATEETCKRSRSERSHESSLSPEPSKHSGQDRSHSNHTSSDSRSRSPRSRSRSRFRVHSPSCSAHSSSKSSQPTHHEGSRSNINHPVPFSTSSSPQHKLSPDIGNKNPSGLMNSPLEDDSDFRTTPKIEHTNNNKQEGKGSAVNDEVPMASFNVDTISNGESLLLDKRANVAGYTGVNLDKRLSDYNDNFASGLQSQNVNCDHSSMKSNQEILAKKGRSKSLKLTTNEVLSVLKHNRMETREVDSLDQRVEEYFGAARLWPWEIIYYRRQKKGPISTENYAKRLEQNKEFGITDQYVRSSSGWWEYH